MISYASIEEIEKNFVACELELIPIEQSNPSDYREKKTEHVLIPIEMLTQAIFDFSEGDILLVRHDNGEVRSVYCKDNTEKIRRIEIIKQILKK